MKFINFISLVIVSFFACNNAKEEKTVNSDSSSVSLKLDSVSENTISETQMQSVNQPVQTADSPIIPGKKSELNQPKSELNKAKIDIKIFQNNDNSGYGYDILIDGRMYVHQPNVPALPGNNGFASEEKARQVAELVVNKIRNNIMPPTVDVKELDSLGIK